MGVAVACQTFLAGVKVPEYMIGDVGVDLLSQQSRVLEPGRRMLAVTGLAMKIPHGYAGLIVPMAQLAIDYGVTVLGAPVLMGRGEVMVPLINHSDEPFTLLPKMHIARLVIVPVERGRFYIGEI